jgi:hypothetical protein
MNRWVVCLIAWISISFVDYAGLGFSPLASFQQQQSSQQGQQDPKQKNGQAPNKENPPPAPAKSNAGSAPTAASSGEKPTPLFGGSLNIKTSRQTKDTATLGFNGVDDNGQVQKNFLASTATGDDTAKVQKLATSAVTAGELDEFIQQGGLNPAAAPKKPN